DRNTPFSPLHEPGRCARLVAGRAASRLAAHLDAPQPRSAPASSFGAGQRFLFRMGKESHQGAPSLGDGRSQPRAQRLFRSKSRSRSNGLSARAVHARTHRIPSAAHAGAGGGGMTAMILAARDYDDDCEFDADVVVVGTGAGGAVAGTELAEGGRRVMFVEE